MARQSKVGGLPVEAIGIGKEGLQALGQVGVASQQGFSIGHVSGLDLL
jgi:hypothetical protein